MEPERPYDLSPEQTERIETNFTYHAPHGTQTARYQNIRDHAKMLAHLICQTTPQSREQSLALTKLEEVSMWANAAIARNEKPSEEDATHEGS